MSHLIFDRRDWKFILTEQLHIEQLLEFERYADFDMDTFLHVFDEAVRFAVDKVAPISDVADREGCRLEGGRVRVPTGMTELWHEYRASGYIAPTHKPEFGGMGLPFSVMAGPTEAVTAACTAFHMYGGLTAGAAHLIECYGTEELKARFVEAMYAGRFGGTMCLTEPQAGTAVGDLATSATPVDEDAGIYDLEGSKIFISGGDAEFYETVVHLVLARVKGDPDGTRGVSLFAVPRDEVAADGTLGAYNNVEITRLEEKLGLHGSATCQIAFGSDKPARGYLVGERCRGLSYMFQMMNEARLACGIQGIALANAAYQQALAYARDRKQGPDLKELSGGSVEIIRHPDVRRNLMLMRSISEGTRALAGQVALWADISVSHPDEAERTRAGDLVDLATPIVKAWSTDKGFKVTELAVQVFGGYGYTREYPAEQYLRDSKIASIYEGTNGVQALDLLGRKMRLKGGALFMTYVMELTAFIDKNRDTPGLETFFASLQTAQSTLGEVAFWISNNAKKNIELAMLQATPFLDLFGDVMIGHMLGTQATIAAARLQELVGTTSPTREQRLNDDNVAFYAGKLDTARFFGNEFLVYAKSKAKSMTSGDTSALDMVF